MPLPKPHYYPAALVAELLARWPADNAALPLAQLEYFLSVAYQASLLFEEGQPVRCRLVLSPTEELLQTATADSLYVLKLATPRPYEEQEIRRLSPALHAPGSLLAVYDHPDAGLLLWGVLRSRQPPPAGEDPWPAAATPVPRVLLLDVRGPGHLVFYCGNQRVLTLQHGHVEGHGFVEYPVAWSWGRFTENLDALRHWLGAGGGATLPELQALDGELAHHITRRVVTRVRASGHGGLVAFVPTATLARFVGPAATLRPKYPVDLAATSPYQHLLLGISTRLRELGEVSWARYQQADDAQLLELAAAADQYANLLADLMSVDGAVVLTKQLAVVGFGIEVYAPQLVLPQVYRALDAAATQLRAELADHGGTRHRAAYRLCRAEPESMAIVVSQDGGVRFVHAQADKVIFWEQLAL